MEHHLAPPDQRALTDSAGRSPYSRAYRFQTWGRPPGRRAIPSLPSVIEPKAV
jgi:hypothetical protein